MTHQEDDDVVACVIEQAAGRIPVIVGAGSNDSHTQLEKSVKYEKMGADGLLLISPYYNKANRQGLIEHFKLSADAVNIPIILYNIPGRTGVNIPVEVVAELSKHPMIQGIKEASGNISYAADIAPLLNEDFKMYSGNDDMIVPILSLGGSGVINVLADVVPFETHDMVHKYLDGDVKGALELQLDDMIVPILSLGGSGVINVLADVVPFETHDMVHKYLDGDVKGALELQLRYLDLIHKLFIEVNPIPVKAAMNLMGKNVGGYRLPLYESVDIVCPYTKWKKPTTKNWKRL